VRGNYFLPVPQQTLRSHHTLDSSALGDVLIVDTSHTYGICDTSYDVITLERGNELLDLGVKFDEILTFKDHMHAKINKA